MKSVIARLYSLYGRAREIWADEGFWALLVRGLRKLIWQPKRIPPAVARSSADFKDPTLHPYPKVSRARLQQFLQSKGYEIVHHIRPKRVYKIAKAGEYFAFKLTAQKGLGVHRDILPHLAGYDFQRLVLPRFVEGGEHDGLGCWVITQWEGGRNFCDRWHEWHRKTAGGRAIPLSYVSIVLELVEDLQCIDVSRLTGIPKLTRDDLARCFLRIPSKRSLRAFHGEYPGGAVLHRQWGFPISQFHRKGVGASGPRGLGGRALVRL